MTETRNTWRALTLAALLLGLAAAGVGAEEVAEACRQDLARRLQIGVEGLTVEEVQPVTWMSGALGLQRPGRAYTKALVPGLRVTLQGPCGQYFYHTGGEVISYAGPAAMWDYSALYLEPIENEANLNSNLMQMSLLGTNPLVLLSGVTDYFPQADGSLLATRRTSRSGFDLLYLALEARNEAKVLASAFSFAHPVLAAEGGQYAVFVRPRVGTAWTVQRGPLEGPLTELPPLPVEGQPRGLLWEARVPLTALVQTEAGTELFRLVEAEDGKHWEALGVRPEEEPGFSAVLNRSYTLVIGSGTAGEPPQPVTRVYTEHFLGAQSNLVVLEGLALMAVEVTPELDFALIKGKRGEGVRTYTVDLTSGEYWETAPELERTLHLLARPTSWEPALARD